jgi:hypothetical protein
MIAHDGYLVWRSAEAGCRFQKSTASGCSLIAKKGAHNCHAGALPFARNRYIIRRMGMAQ